MTERTAAAGAGRNGPTGEMLHDGHAVHGVIAPTTVLDERTRVLKHNDTFAVFDHVGDIEPGGLGEQGLFHEGTRYLSGLRLELDGHRPFVLGSTVRDENDQLAVDLTNPDFVHGRRIAIPLGTLHLSRKTFLWDATCYQQLHVKNHGSRPVRLTLTLVFRADYADIYEVRGMPRAARGQDLPPEFTDRQVILGYRGLDNEVRRTALQFDPPPHRLTATTARFDLSLAPREEMAIHLAAACRRGEDGLDLTPVESARAASAAALERHQAGCCHIRSGHEPFDAWVRRAESDLHMLVSDLPSGPYPYAGMPWFNTPFGRDGLLTALECLWLRPDLARGVLAYLAATQAAEAVPDQDAEPGKVLHETRNGEMAGLKEMPFGRYYGSVDGTPLFVLLAGAYYERTGDRAFAEDLWPHVAAALGWIDCYGDRDSDGFVEYHRQSGDGLVHQGWKDTDNAVFHADGTPAEGPIALCEVQGYVYAARRAGAVLAGALGWADRAAELTRQAEELRERFEQAFWCDDLETYALALDGAKRPCRVRTSNAGQCLFTGIAGPERARRVARGLMGPALFSGWGVRTLAATEAHYNPMAYHNGAVWPHDNALIAYGFSRYGLPETAVRLLTGLYEAGTHFELHRMPELFCGFPRQPREGPILYPVACAPQAWSAASVFLLLQACLGLGVNAREAHVYFHRPCLPDFLKEIRITNLAVAGATVDLLLRRHEDDVGVHVLRRDGDVQVVVVK